MVSKKMSKTIAESLIEQYNTEPDADSSPAYKRIKETKINSFEQDDREFYVYADGSMICNPALLEPMFALSPEHVAQKPLVAGVKLAAEILSAARKAGIARTTLYRAKKATGVMSYRDSQHRVWWALPDKTPADLFSSKAQDGR